MNVSLSVGSSLSTATPGLTKVSVSLSVLSTQTHPLVRYVIHHLKKEPIIVNVSLSVGPSLSTAMPGPTKVSVSLSVFSAEPQLVVGHGTHHLYKGTVAESVSFTVVSFPLRLVVGPDI